MSNANGYLGSVGSGQASQNADSLEGSSAACSEYINSKVSGWLSLIFVLIRSSSGLTGCVTSAAASNGNSTSTTSSSTGGLINGPLISGPLIEIGQ